MITFEVESLGWEILSYSDDVTSPISELWSEVKVAMEELKIEVKRKVKERGKMDKSNILSWKEGM